MGLEGKAQPVLQLRGIGKTYGATTALEHVTLSLSKGELVGLIGPNGAGKTTLMEIVEGVNIPTSGMATIFGEDPTRLSTRARGRIGLVFQRYSLPGYITVLELATLFRTALCVSAGNDELFVNLGLMHLQKQRISDLSAGQQQRMPEETVWF
ncbi:ABC-type multidrug transport system ATPase subunit [Luteibacter sp. Sphag1AF]|uniref:ATP-binding cassette domain-containing protein n=1 Tax=Luteibacter sp. Sphag1AF TaxID=2587031 RepID=UPI0016121372|nr:ATP-binding cassette domain-containing protein [Luteibacter sp. Sphag1AF]MBB3228709.1 ABC-type multidrug transport system ATPase subunit [Luteibacter sp. Sphag1AF]